MDNIILSRFVQYEADDFTRANPSLAARLNGHIEAAIGIASSGMVTETTDGFLRVASPADPRAFYCVPVLVSEQWRNGFAFDCGCAEQQAQPGHYCVHLLAANFWLHARADVAEFMREWEVYDCERVTEQIEEGKIILSGARVAQCARLLERKPDHDYTTRKGKSQHRRTNNRSNHDTLRGNH